jgi:hypothetical protein
MKTKRFRAGDSVMVQSTKAEFEDADGMRGIVSAVRGAVVTIECRLVGETHVIRMPVSQLVHCWVRA